MGRDHRKLKTFQIADDLVFDVYQKTKCFPREELFGLTSQMRRAAVSVPANIAEGCARPSLKEYLRFLDISAGSLAELEYYIHLAHRLGYINENDHGKLDEQRRSCAQKLGALSKSLRRKA